MKVIVVASQSADGFIAKSSDHLADWSSKQDKGTFVRLTKEMGIMVMGANQYHTINRALPGRRTIVYTHHPERIAEPQIETTTEDPAALIARLEAEGAHGLAICGGTQIYDLFMQSGLVTDLYIVTEPILFGSGLTLFSKPITQKIELFESTNRRGNCVVNHYKVVG